MNTVFLNKSNDFVVEAIEGAVACIPHLQRLDGFPQVHSFVITIQTALWLKELSPAYNYISQLILRDAGEGTLRWGGRQKQGGSHLR